MHDGIPVQKNSQPFYTFFPIDVNSSCLNIRQKLEKNEINCHHRKLLLESVHYFTLKVRSVISSRLSKWIIQGTTSVYGRWLDDRTGPQGRRIDQHTDTDACAKAPTGFVFSGFIFSAMTEFNLIKVAKWVRKVINKTCSKTVCKDGWCSTSTQC